MLLGALALALVLFAAPLTVEAQDVRKIPRIGVLFDDAVSSEPLRQDLRDLGYVKGTDIVFEERGYAGRHERWPDLVAELVRLKVDIIVTRSTPATLAAKRATTTIPIVIAGAGDPLSTGLVSSLAHPARGPFVGTVSTTVNAEPPRAAGAQAGVADVER